MVARDERIVSESADERAEKRPCNRNPPPRVAGAKHVAAPTRDRREEARAEIARRIDGVPSVVPERHANRDHEDSDDNWSDRRVGRRISAVAERKDDRDEKRRADNLIDEPAGHGAQEFLRIRRPDSGGPARTGNLANTP